MGGLGGMYLWQRGSRGLFEDFQNLLWQGHPETLKELGYG
jgi:hypothetical protein